MKHATGELGDRAPRDRKVRPIPQAVAETTALREKREAASKPAKAPAKKAAKSSKK